MWHVLRTGWAIDRQALGPAPSHQCIYYLRPRTFEGLSGRSVPTVRKYRRVRSDLRRPARDAATVHGQTTRRRIPFARCVQDDRAWPRLLVVRSNDPSSATRPTRAFDCNLDAMAGFAAAHG